MTNIEKVRDFIFKQFQTQMDIPFRNIGIEHTLQVVSYAIMLSKKRNIDPEEAMIAAYFHDISTYLTHYSHNHATRSYEFANEHLPKITTLSNEQILRITQAIKNHSTKQIIHDDLSELLKDADVLAHYYAGTILDDIEKTRLEKNI